MVEGESRCGDCGCNTWRVFTLPDGGALELVEERTMLMILGCRTGQIVDAWKVSRNLRCSFLPVIMID